MVIVDQRSLVWLLRRMLAGRLTPGTDELSVAMKKYPLVAKSKSPLVAR